MKKSSIRLLSMLSLVVSSLAAPSFAQDVRYTILSSGVDATYAGSVDGSIALPFGINASGYFDHNDLDGASREDARVVATREVFRGILAAYELRAHDQDAPNRFGVGYRTPFGVTAVYFPYGVDFDTSTVDEDGQTVQVNGTRAVGAWNVGGTVDVTRRAGATRYWGTATASRAIAPRTAVVVEYRARPGDDATTRSVLFGLTLDVR